MRTPKMTAWLQGELHALAVRLARNDGARSQSIAERISELAEASGFSWHFIDSNVKARAAEIQRGGVCA